MLERWMMIQKEEVRSTSFLLDDADIAVIGFGTAGRVALSAVRQARLEGIKAGLFRPITLSPFPDQEIRELADQVKKILVVEMNSGQMLEDIRMAAQDKVPVEFYGRLGGMVPFPNEILSEIRRVHENQEQLSNTDARENWLRRLAALRGVN
jgi:2-oxoglutarate ferredoxin oxidoreductase subunit alpha